MENPPFDITTAKQVSKDGFSRRKDGVAVMSGCAIAKTADQTHLA